VKSHLQDLYQELILDHNRRPRNRGTLPDATHHAEGRNPLCGDKIAIYLQVDDGRVTEARFDGAGCAISTASASLMTESLKGKTVAEVRALFEDFRALVMGKAGPSSAPAALGKLAALRGVCEYPVRVKCATLAWHTLLAALDQPGRPVSTERPAPDGAREGA
jgi:nitrogen fixation NifU-like protein